MCINASGFDRKKFELRLGQLNAVTKAGEESHIFFTNATDGLTQKLYFIHFYILFVSSLAIGMFSQKEENTERQ